MATAVYEQNVPVFASSAESPEFHPYFYLESELSEHQACVVVKTKLLKTKLIIKNGISLLAVWTPTKKTLYSLELVFSGNALGSEAV